MGLLQMLGGGIAEAAKGITQTVTAYKEKKLDAEQAMQQLLAGEAQLQLEVNRVEAAHPSVFVSGWRPAVGWICVVGLGYQYIFAPLVNGFLGIPRFPSLDLGELMPLLFGLLGLAGMRTWEKGKEVARN